MGNSGILLRGAALAILYAIYLFWFNILATVYRPPPSVVDGQCARLWVARARNDPALECYLKQQASRLCETLERENLGWKFRLYAHDNGLFVADMAVTLVSFNTNLAAQTATDPNGDTVKAIQSAGDKSSKEIRDNGVAAAMRVNMIPRIKLVAMIHELALRGLISLDDFGWWPDSLISDAFEGMAGVKSPCGKP